MEKFRTFEKFRVGNYVKHDGRLLRIEGIDDKDVYTLKDIVYGDIIMSDKPVSGIKLTEEIIGKFNFVKTPRNNQAFFKNGELFLIDYTSKEGYGKFCVYHEFVKSYVDVKKCSCAIFYIHALQNFIEGNSNLIEESINFDEKINCLLEESILFRSKFV